MVNRWWDRQTTTATEVAPAVAAVAVAVVVSAAPAPQEVIHTLLGRTLAGSSEDSTITLLHTIRIPPPLGAITILQTYMATATMTITPDRMVTKGNKGKRK